MYVRAVCMRIEQMGRMRRIPLTSNQTTRTTQPKRSANSWVERLRIPDLRVLGATAPSFGEWGLEERVMDTRCARRVRAGERAWLGVGEIAAVMSRLVEVTAVGT